MKNISSPFQPPHPSLSPFQGERIKVRGWLVIAISMLFLVAAPAMAEGVKVGNTVCPVSGDKVSGKHFVVHEGKQYALCCPHCAKEFKKNPAKYIAQLKAGKAHEHAGHDHSH